MGRRGEEKGGKGGSSMSTENNAQDFLSFSRKEKAELMVEDKREKTSGF